MSDFSRTPLELLLESRRKGYVGLHIEQGVPLLDRDLNLLQDLIVAEVRSLFSRYVGDGASADAGGFRIEPAAAPAQNFRIGAGPRGGSGSVLVDGLDVVIPAPVDYRDQGSAPPLTTPVAPAPDPREDVVYLDAWIEEVDSSADDDLANGDDIGMQTSTRLAVRWAVLVAEGQPVPAAAAGHVRYPLARLRRPRGVPTVSAAMITDLRRRRLTVADLERRLSLAERVLLLPSFATDVPAFSPPAGITDQPIQINGSNLDVGTLAVSFGDRPAQLVGPPSATQVVVRVPAGLTPDGQRVSVPITLGNEGGSAVSTDLFEVRPAPAFGTKGQQFTPVHAAAGAQVVLSGANFNTGDVVVTFGSKQATVVGTPTNPRLVALVPAGLAGGVGPALFKINVANGFGLKTSDDTFQADAGVAPPTLDPANEFSPPKGAAGTPVTLNGQNLDNAPKVKFDTADATLTGPTSSTQITVQVPAGLVPAGQQRKVNITVTTPGGVATTQGQFVVTG